MTGRRAPRLALDFASAFLGLSCTPVQPLMVPVPRHPDMLRSAGAIGDASVRVMVGPTGRVKAIHVHTEATSLGDARSLVVSAIQRAMRGAQFAPARRLGMPVSSETDFVYRFALTRPGAPMRPDERPGMTDSLPMTRPLRPR